MTIHETINPSSKRVTPDSTPFTDVATRYAQKVAHLRCDYRGELQTNLSLIAADWHVLQHHWSPVVSQRLYRLVHTLAGSGATFGFPTVSETARDLATLVKPLLAAASIDTCMACQISRLVMALAAAAKNDDTVYSEHAAFFTAPLSNCSAWSAKKRSW